VIFSEPELESQDFFDPGTSDTTWRDFFVSELEDRLDMQGLGSPDSGIELNNFDIENPFIRENDPVISQEEFQDEVDFMFNKHTFNDAGLDLDLDFIMPEVLSFEPDHLPPKSEPEVSMENLMADEPVIEDSVSVGNHSSDSDNCFIKKNTSKPVKSKSNPAIKVHSYAVAPRTKRLQSMLRKGDHKSSRSKRSMPKKKLYELQRPLDNPQAERCRLNAINAKKNRDRKKRELEAASSEIERLRRENAELKAEAENAREEREEAFAELEMMKSELKMLGLPVDEREE